MQYQGSQWSRSALIFVAGLHLVPCQTHILYSDGSQRSESLGVLCVFFELVVFLLLKNS